MTLDMIPPIHAHLTIFLEGVVLSNGIFWSFEEPNPFPWMSIPHPTSLFVGRSTIGHFQKCSQIQCHQI
jgi:hypothetical protein